MLLRPSMRGVTRATGGLEIENPTGTLNIANNGHVLLGKAAVTSGRRAFKSKVLFRTGRQKSIWATPLFSWWFLQNAATQEASIGNVGTLQFVVAEYNGISVRVTFGGNDTYTFTDGQTLLEPDPIQASAFGLTRFPSRAWITIKLDGDVPSGFIPIGVKTNRAGESMCFYDPANRDNSDMLTYGAFTLPTGAQAGIAGYRPLMLVGSMTQPDISHRTDGDSLVYGSFGFTGDGENNGSWRAQACFNLGVPYFCCAIGGHQIANYASSHAKRAALMVYSNDAFFELGSNDLGSTTNSASTMWTGMRSWQTDAKTNLQAPKNMYAMGAYFPRTTALGVVDGTLNNQIILGAFSPGERKDQLIRNMRTDIGSVTYGLTGLFDPRTPESAHKQRWTLKTGVAAGANQISLVGSAIPRVGDILGLEMDYEGETPLTVGSLSASVAANASSFTMAGVSSNRPTTGTRVMVDGETRVVSSATGSGTLTIGVSKPFTNAHASGAALAFHSAEVPVQSGTLTNAASIGNNSFLVNTVSKPVQGTTLVFEPGVANTESLTISTVTGSTGAWTVVTSTNATKNHASASALTIPAAISAVSGSGTSPDPWIVTLDGTLSKAHVADVSVDAGDLWPTRPYTATSLSATTIGGSTIVVDAAPTVPELILIEPGLAGLEWQNVQSVSGTGPYTLTIEGAGFTAVHASGKVIKAAASGDLVHPGAPIHASMGILSAIELDTHAKA